MTTKTFQKPPKALLGTLVNIRTGYNFRERIEPTSSGNIRIIQTKDITNDGNLHLTNLPSVELSEIKEEHFLHKGDILLRSRGGVNFPVALVSNLHYKAIAAFPILLLRVNNPVITPDYLAWQLNQKQTQTLLQKLTQSTFVPSLSKSSLLEIPISLPPLSIQEQIVALNQMLHAENHLIQQISAKRQTLAHRLLIRYAEQPPTKSEISEFFRPIILDFN